MTPRFREKLILIYGSIVAFLLSIAGGLMATKIYYIIYGNVILILSTILFILYLCYRLIEDITRMLGVRKPHPSPKIPIKNPYEVSKAIYEKYGKKKKLIRFRANEYHKKIIVWIVYVYPVILFFIALGIIAIFTTYWEIFFPLGLLLIMIFLETKASDRFQYWLEKDIFLSIAMKWELSVDFLIFGRGILHPNEYHIIVDFEKNEYYFLRYHPKKLLEKKYNEIIEKVENPMILETPQ